MTMEKLQQTREYAENATHGYMFNGENTYLKAVRELKKAVELYNSNNLPKVKLDIDRVVYTASSKRLNDSVNVYKILAEEQEREHPIIKEWYSYDETEQYNILTRCIRKAAKRYGYIHILQKYDIDELVSETWLRLQPKLDNNYIAKANKSLISMGRPNITLSFLVFRAANVALAAICQSNNKHNMQAGHLTSSDEELDYLNIIPDYSTNPEEITFSNMIKEWLMNNYSGINQEIICGLLDEYTQGEIAKNVGLSRQTINKHVMRIRKTVKMQLAY